MLSQSMGNKDRGVPEYGDKEKVSQSIGRVWYKASKVSQSVPRGPSGCQSVARGPSGRRYQILGLGRHSPKWVPLDPHGALRILGPIRENISPPSWAGAKQRGTQWGPQAPASEHIEYHPYSIYKSATGASPALTWHSSDSASVVSLLFSFHPQPVPATRLVLSSSSYESQRPRTSDHSHIALPSPPFHSYLLFFSRLSFATRSVLLLSSPPHPLTPLQYG
jgi:hypothetical protein